jgi:hypothetical protein
MSVEEKANTFASGLGYALLLEPRWRERALVCGHIRPIMGRRVGEEDRKPQPTKRGSFAINDGEKDGEEAGLDRTRAGALVSPQDLCVMMDYPE